MTMTKYEYQKQQEEERRKYASNLNDLNKQLAEAKDLYRTIQGLEQSFGNQHAARETLKEIHRLESIIEDEREAYKSTFDAAPGNFEKLCNLMNI